VALQPTFMHNGAFVRLEDAIRYHLDAGRHASEYTPSALATDLRGPMGPIAPVLSRLDPALRAPVALTDQELSDLVSFVAEGLLDPAARPVRLRHLVPQVLPSGAPALTFEFR
jgi:cytochrome c peroxidase